MFTSNALCLFVFYLFDKFALQFPLLFQSHVERNGKGTVIIRKTETFANTQRNYSLFTDVNQKMVFRRNFFKDLIKEKSCDWPVELA